MKSTLLPPREWSDFEDLCCDIWQKMWGKENVQRFGRQGQSQHGIDILFQGNNETKAVQCKLTSDELTTDDIDNIIEKAKEFEPKLSKFVIATSAKRDSKIQAYIAKLNKNREKGSFETHIWAWHDITEFLDENIDIMRNHYSEHVAKFFDKLIFSLFEK